MSWLPLCAAFALGALGAPGTGGDSSAVYHFRDAKGVDHYVNHPDLVPAGTASDHLKLSDDLNPELAKEMAESAHRAAEEVKAKAAEAARLQAEEQARKEEAGTAATKPPPPAPFPAEARLLLVWSIAFTVVFTVLWLTRGLLLRRSPALAIAFQPLRWGAGGAALLSWIFLAVLARGWIVDHFPPLQAISRARANVDKINREQRDSERELDKALKGR